jgi:hypothetical protein
MRAQSRLRTQDVCSSKDGWSAQPCINANTEDSEKRDGDSTPIILDPSSNLPPRRSFMFRYVRLLLTDPKYFWILASLVILGDAVLTEAIILFIPCQSILFQVIRWLNNCRHRNRLGNIYDTSRAVSQRRARLLPSEWTDRPSCVRMLQMSVPFTDLCSQISSGPCLYTPISLPIDERREGPCLSTAYLWNTVSNL